MGAQLAGRQGSDEQASMPSACLAVGVVVEVKESHAFAKATLILFNFFFFGLA
jgi:hypothetical protein